MYSKVRHTLVLAEYENFGLEVGANVTILLLKALGDLCNFDQ